MGSAHNLSRNTFPSGNAWRPQMRKGDKEDVMGGLDPKLLGGAYIHGTLNIVGVLIQNRSSWVRGTGEESTVAMLVAEPVSRPSQRGSGPTLAQGGR